MKKIFTPALFSLILFSATALTSNSKDESLQANIRRLTYSGNNIVRYPSLSEDGRWMIYVIEIKEEEKTIKAVRMMNVEDGRERELFRDGSMKGLSPFQNVPLMVGSKPPLLSGNGEKAIFALSLGKPANILDHYLALADSDGSNFWVTSFPVDALKGKDLKSLEFESGDWERISNYALSNDGKRIACVLKGHLGPRRYGNPSAVIFLEPSKKEQRTILGPDFGQGKWTWTSFPCQPLTGGGWAFSMSGNGEWTVFGAQSSADKNDYDLYAASWDGSQMKRITDFHDRWFSLADISEDGQKVVFFYNGKSKKGIGTYEVHRDGSGLKFLESKITPQIEFFDMSGNGRFLLYKNIYKGMIFDLDQGLEMKAFDENTRGYVRGLFPMDFPQIPAFWSPKIMSFEGDKILLIGPPEAKETAEVFLLSLKMK
jgi:hypothetical protein